MENPTSLGWKTVSMDLGNLFMRFVIYGAGAVGGCVPLHPTLAVSLRFGSKNPNP